MSSGNEELGGHAEEVVHGSGCSGMHGEEEGERGKGIRSTGERSPPPALLKPERYRGSIGVVLGIT